MPRKKSATKARRGLKATAAPGIDWKRSLRSTLWLGLAFAAGVIAGMRQGWVEGHQSMKGQYQLWQVRELEGGRIVKHGLFRERYPASPAVKEEGDYFLDQKHGVWTEFYKNGGLKSKAVYVNGELQAGRMEWDENGRVLVKKEPF